MSGPPKFFFFFLLFSNPQEIFNPHPSPSSSTMPTHRLFRALVRLHRHELRFVVALERLQTGALLQQRVILQQRAHVVEHLVELAGRRLQQEVGGDADLKGVQNLYYLFNYLFGKKFFLKSGIHKKVQRCRNIIQLNSKHHRLLKDFLLSFTSSNFSFIQYM